MEGEQWVRVGDSQRRKEYNGLVREFNATQKDLSKLRGEVTKKDKALRTLKLKVKALQDKKEEEERERIGKEGIDPAMTVDSCQLEKAYWKDVCLALEEQLESLQIDINRLLLEAHSNKCHICFCWGDRNPLLRNISETLFFSSRHHH
jgi:hypothetical protein